MLKSGFKLWVLGHQSPRCQPLDMVPFWTGASPKERRQDSSPGCPNLCVHYAVPWVIDGISVLNYPSNMIHLKGFSRQENHFALPNKNSLDFNPSRLSILFWWRYPFRQRLRGVVTITETTRWTNPTLPICGHFDAPGEEAHPWNMKCQNSEKQWAKCHNIRNDGIEKF